LRSSFVGEVAAHFLRSTPTKALHNLVPNGVNVELLKKIEGE